MTELEQQVANSLKSQTTEPIVLDAIEGWLAPRVAAAIQAAATWKEYPTHPWVAARRDAALAALLGEP